MMKLLPKLYLLPAGKITKNIWARAITNRASHGGSVGFGLLGFVLQDLLAIQNGDYFVDISSGCGLIPNTIGLYQPLATAVGIERNKFWSFIAAITSTILANHEPCIFCLPLQIFTGKISHMRTSWRII